MLPHQFDADRYHPEGELFVINPKDHFAVPMIKAYAKELGKEAEKLDRRKSDPVLIKGRPQSYWLRKKQTGAQKIAVTIARFQAKHPEMVKYPD